MPLALTLDFYCRKKSGKNAASKVKTQPSKSKWKPDPSFDDLMRRVLQVKPEKKKSAKRKK
jgi:hypothetical protein